MLPLSSGRSNPRHFLSYLYSLSVFILLLANFTLSYITMETGSASSLSLLIRYLISGLSVIFVLVTLYKAHTNQTLFQEVIEEVIDLSQRNMRSNRNVVFYRPNYRHLNAKIQFCCFTYLLVMFISFEILHSFLPNLTLFAVLNFLVPNLYSLLLSVEFYLLLNFVQNRLEKMYQYFQNFNQDSLLITDNWYYLSKISRDNVKSELVFLLKTFYSIFNICAKINTMFSAQILLVIILTHVLLTCIAYVMTQAIITYLTDAAATLQYNVMYTNLYWFGFHWVMIVLIVVPCENINTLKRNIMKTVHQIIIEDKMPNLTLELEMFLMDLEKYNIQFTAHGFFSLEYSLFRKIIGAVATYWILLIQFQ
ncbi:hypothetical protein M8J76_007913 [Diaphorina citri]|nr:hypothetical protein M8J75_004394 [Diaphorina citri]KAI5736867.1 hypothetical protein M8J76_007913 [Diaphorina citri]